MATRTMNLSAASMPLELKIEWVLRVATAGCFIGHGAFGIITKAAWLPYFAVAAIPADAAWALMPWVGAMDIAMGLAALCAPWRILIVWCVAWAVWTASLRPLAGESFWELLERGGNFGAPLAFLALAGWRGNWTDRLTVPVDRLRSRFPRKELNLVLRLATATLLIGHAGCCFFDHKPVFLELTQSVIPAASLVTLQWVGLFEFALAGFVLLHPSAVLLLFVCIWKLATESLWPVAGYPFWEFIERCGSYGVPLAFALLLHRPKEARSSF